MRQASELQSRGAFPNPHGTVPTSRCQSTRIVRDGDRDGSEFVWKLQDLPPGRDLPNARRIVVASSDHDATVATEGDRHRNDVVLHAGQLAPRGQVENPHGAGVVGRAQPPAVRAEGECTYGIRNGEPRHDIACTDVEQPEYGEFRGREEPTIGAHDSAGGVIELHISDHARTIGGPYAGG